MGESVTLCPDVQALELSTEGPIKPTLTAVPEAKKCDWQFHYLGAKCR